MLQLQDNLARDQEFQPRFQFSFDLGHYRVKTATTHREILSSLRLRHQIFYEEMMHSSHPSGLDVDRYDEMFDHLIIVDIRKDLVIATYRLYSSRWGDDYYTRSEFDLSQLHRVQGPFLEMGRACVHPDYRKGAVMTLLWRGIAEYLKMSDSKVLMGCGSIKTEDVYMTALLTRYFQSTGQLPSPPIVTPLPQYHMDGFAKELARLQTMELTPEQISVVEEQIPSLFRTYLKMGAIVAGPPAYDRDFQCIDFVVLLEMEKLNSLYGKKYRVASAEDDKIN